MSIEKNLGNLAFLGVLGLVHVILIGGIYNQGKYEQTRREVQMRIDKDHNGIITQEEWKPVYESLGVKSRLHNVPQAGYGFDLSREQLETYLEKFLEESGGKNE